jgi:hypothetical protein
VTAVDVWDFTLIAYLENGGSPARSTWAMIAVEGFPKGAQWRLSYGTWRSRRARSVGAVYAQMEVEATTLEVAQRAGASGAAREDCGHSSPNDSNVLGTASPHPLDMAGVNAVPERAPSRSSCSGRVHRGWQRYENKRPRSGSTPT